MIFNDNIARPYVYLITFNETKEYYFGYREANTKPAHLDIGLVYFTSSKKIHTKLYFTGLENITIDILNEFEGPNAGNDAFDSEQALIWQNWDDGLLLNGNIRLPNGEKRFKAKKGEESYRYGKTYEEIYGFEKAIKLKNIKAKAMLGKNKGAWSELRREAAIKLINTTYEQMAEDEKVRLSKKLSDGQRKRYAKCKDSEETKIKKSNSHKGVFFIKSPNGQEWVTDLGLKEFSKKFKNEVLVTYWQLFNAYRSCYTNKVKKYNKPKSWFVERLDKK